MFWSLICLLTACHLDSLQGGRLAWARWDNRSSAPSSNMNPGPPPVHLPFILFPSSLSRKLQNSTSKRTSHAESDPRCKLKSEMKPTNLESHSDNNDNSIPKYRIDYHSPQHNNKKGLNK
ncbi:hypothetical protein BP00DRAFT_250963 [Aspergillus indologenus CBS 114.80]|uniref:Secreted protein n=1 Tax=Aspergillus indologenus CBS 114.80 TaxID=1450541 RepID=A0A2V5IX54_9EURO|nr:hypothetical protein BP00DRAFT_250963 [Aspergillus indologenus CBS 114.80]